MCAYKYVHRKMNQTGTLHFHKVKETNRRNMKGYVSKSLSSLGSDYEEYGLLGCKTM